MSKNVGHMSASKVTLLPSFLRENMTLTRGEHERRPKTLTKKGQHVVAQMEIVMARK